MGTSRLRSFARLPLLLLLTLFSSCGDDSRVLITSPFFFSSTNFLQIDLSGHWSGTLHFDGSAYTVFIDVNGVGDVVGGLESDRDNIVDGFFRLLEEVSGEMELRFETDTGVVVTGLGTLQVGNQRISAQFSSSEGFNGTILLAKTFGPGTFTIPFIQGNYFAELADFNYQVLRQGQINIIFSGYAEIGTIFDGQGVINGQFVILNSLTGEYQAFIALESGEIIFVDGLISLADRVLGGIETSDLGHPVGIATFFPL